MRVDRSASESSIASVVLARQSERSVGGGAACAKDPIIVAARLRISSEVSDLAKRATRLQESEGSNCQLEVHTHITLTTYPDTLPCATISDFLVRLPMTALRIARRRATSCSEASDCITPGAVMTWGEDKPGSPHDHDRRAVRVLNE